MSQAQSKTTVAGCTLEDLCRGVKNYVCDASCLVGLEGIDVIAAKDELLSQLSKIFDEIELQTDCKVKKFYIGKAIIKKRKSRGRQRTYVPFNPMDPYTWKKSGVSSRWCAHRDKEYGKDGLVVLGAVTRDSVPNVCHGKVNQEQYAIALQQMILHHLMLIVGDDRLQNETFLVSGTDGGKSIAYAIYVAFTLEQQALSENGDFLRYSPSSSEASPLHEQYNDDSIVDLRTLSNNDDNQSDNDSLPPFPPMSISPLRQYEVSTKGTLVNTMEVNSIASPLSLNNQTTNSLTPSDTETRMEEDILLGLYDHSVVCPTQLFNKPVVHKKKNGTSEVTANNESTFMFHDQNALQSNASLVNSSQQAKHLSIILPTLQFSASETNKRQPNTSTCKPINSTTSTAVEATSMNIPQPMTVDLPLQNQLKSRNSQQISRKRPSISTFESTNAKCTGPKVSRKKNLPKLSQQAPPDTSKAITILPSYEPQQNYASVAKFRKIDGSQPIYDPKTGNDTSKVITSSSLHVVVPTCPIPPNLKTIERSQGTYNQKTSKPTDAMERNNMSSAMLKKSDLPSVSNRTANSYIPPPKKVKTSQVKAQSQTVTTKAVLPENKRLETLQNTLEGYPTTSTLSQSTKMLTSTSQISSSKRKVHALPPKPNLNVPVTTVNTSSIILDKCRQTPKKTKKVTFYEPTVVSKESNTSSSSSRNEFKLDNPKLQTGTSKLCNDNICNVELKRDLSQPILSMKQPKVSTVSLTSVQDHLPHNQVITSNYIETVTKSASLPLKSAPSPMKVPKNKEKQKHVNSSTSCSYVSVIQSQPKDFTKQ